MNEPVVEFSAAVTRAYQRTREHFDILATNEPYRPYVVPASTSPIAGFAIFYTPPVHKPNLLIVAQNPSNFAGKGLSLLAAANATMLAGVPPVINSYEDHEHIFGVTLRGELQRRPALHQNSVGMNVWHFQCISDAAKAPRDLRRFCEETTADLIDAMHPTNVLCIGRPAFQALAGAGRPVAGARKAEVARRGDSTFWHVPHLTGRWSRADGAHDLPIVMDAMTA